MALVSTDKVEWDRGRDSQGHGLPKLLHRLSPVVIEVSAWLRLGLLGREGSRHRTRCGPDADLARTLSSASKAPSDR